ncbi:MAG: hypothetical protein AAF249_14735 [Pseudomonadota bacterium]
MMRFLTDGSRRELFQRGIGFFFGGAAIGLTSTRIENDAAAIALLLACCALLMLAIAVLMNAAIKPEAEG